MDVSANHKRTQSALFELQIYCVRTRLKGVKLYNTRRNDVFIAALLIDGIMFCDFQCESFSEAESSSFEEHAAQIDFVPSHPEAANYVVQVRN